MEKHNINIKNSELSKVKNSIKEDMVKELEILSKEISEQLPKNPTIDIATFETYFLPFIIGKVEKNENNLKLFILNFLDITKSYYLPIDVLDENGITKYTLPPLMLHIDIERSNKLAYSRVVKTYDLLTQNNPMQADLLLKNFIKNLDNEIGKKEDEERKYIISIKRIMEDYLKNENNGKKNTELGDEDIFEF